MNARERIETFWSGEKPDWIPYNVNEEIYKQHQPDDPQWVKLFEMGMGLSSNVCTYRQKVNDVTYHSEKFKLDGRSAEKQTIKTPVGSVYRILVDGWTQRYYIHDSNDYRVMCYVAENTQIFPAYEEYNIWEKRISIAGLTGIAVPRMIVSKTPMQMILVNYVGLENLAYHFVDFNDELQELYEAILKNFSKMVEIVTEGPGRFVWFLENMTAETMGPERFKKYHMPVYLKYFPNVKAKGKIVATHFDGKLDKLKEIIEEAPIDIIESLTPPPEGDMTLDECRKAWPEKLFWSNINVSNYELPELELRKLVIDRAKSGAVAGKRIAFEISEELPRNWRQSLSVVLSALREMT